MSTNPANNYERIIADVLSLLDASATLNTGTSPVSWPTYRASGPAQVGSDDNAFPDLEVVFAVQNAFEYVGKMILDSEDDAARSQFLVLSAALLNGDTLAKHVGAPGSVFVKKNNAAGYEIAYPRELQAVQFMRSKQIFVRDLYFHITGSQQIYFTGILDGVTDNSRAKVLLGTLDKTASSSYDNLTGEVMDWIVCRALAKLFAKAGDNMGGGNYYKNLADDFAGAFLAKKKPPKFKPYKEESD